MTVTDHITHESKLGTLAIDIATETDGSVSAAATFESADTGVLYVATLDAAAIAALNRIFIGAPELFADFARESPEITLARDSVVAHFVAAHGKREYKFDLSCGRKVYGNDATGIGELQQENRVLRRKVATLEERIAKLEIREGLRDAEPDEFSTPEDIAAHAKRKEDSLISRIERLALDFEVNDYERLITSGIDVNMSGTHHYVFDIIFDIRQTNNWQKRINRALFIIEHGLRLDHKHSGGWGDKVQTISEHITRQREAIQELIKYDTGIYVQAQQPGEPYRSIYDNRDAILAGLDQLMRACNPEQAANNSQNPAKPPKTVGKAAPKGKQAK